MIYYFDVALYKAKYFQTQFWTEMDLQNMINMKACIYMIVMTDVFINLPILGMLHGLIFVTYFFIWKRCYMGKDDKCPRTESAEAILIPLILWEDQPLFPFQLQDHMGNQFVWDSRFEH